MLFQKPIFLLCIYHKNTFNIYIYNPTHKIIHWAKSTFMKETTLKQRGIFYCNITILLLLGIVNVEGLVRQN